jgi:hypothetical protein
MSILLDLNISSPGLNVYLAGVNISLYIYIYMYVCIYIYMYIYTYIYVYVYVYIVYLYYTYTEYRCTFSIDPTVRNPVEPDRTTRTIWLNLTRTHQGTI